MKIYDKIFGKKEADEEIKKTVDEDGTETEVKVEKHWFRKLVGYGGLGITAVLLGTVTGAMIASAAVALEGATILAAVLYWLTTAMMAVATAAMTAFTVDMVKNGRYEEAFVIVTVQAASIAREIFMTVVRSFISGEFRMSSAPRSETPKASSRPATAAAM